MGHNGFSNCTQNSRLTRRRCTLPCHRSLPELLLPYKCPFCPLVPLCGQQTVAKWPVMHTSAPHKPGNDRRLRRTFQADTSSCPPGPPHERNVFLLPVRTQSQTCLLQFHWLTKTVHPFRMDRRSYPGPANRLLPLTKPFSQLLPFLSAARRRLPEFSVRRPVQTVESPFKTSACFPVEISRPLLLAHQPLPTSLRPSSL